MGRLLAGREKVRKAAGKPMGTVETNDSATFLSMISQQGSGYYSKNGKLILNSKKNIDTLNDVKDMVNDKTLLLSSRRRPSQRRILRFYESGRGSLRADAHLVHGTVYRLYA